MKNTIEHLEVDIERLFLEIKACEDEQEREVMISAHNDMYSALYKLRVVNQFKSE